MLVISCCARFYFRCCCFLDVIVIAAEYWCIVVNCLSMFRGFIIITEDLRTKGGLTHIECILR